MIESKSGAERKIYLAVENTELPKADVHATILYMLGLDHMRLTYMHNGRAERPTVLAGEVVKGVFS